MKGPGKYDDLATLVRERADAEAVVVVVLGGNKGSGFSVQATDQWVSYKLPELMRALAEQIERSEG